MTKPRDLIIRFRLPQDRRITNGSVSIRPDGAIVIKDDDGNEVIPESMERSVQYDRPKGPKIQSQHQISNGRVSVGGLTELARLDSVFVVDTNSKIIKRKPIAVTCFVCVRFVPEGGRFRLVPEERVNFYEFHNVSGNPEMLGVLKIARDVVRSAGKRTNFKVALVSDSEIGAHNAINTRQRPVYGSHYLPEGFILNYASSDTGQEPLNQILRFCDRWSSKYIRELEAGSINGLELKPLEDEPPVMYRYMFREGLEVANSLMTGVSPQPGTTVSLYRLGQHTD